MSTRLRAGLAVAALALAIVLFVVLQDDGGEGEPAPATTEQAQTDPGSEAGDGRGGGVAEKPRPEQPPKPEQPAEPEIATIVVRGGEPVGGVAELAFTKGERIRFRVTSDVADHVHLHGYDVFEDIAAGGEARFDLPATLEGVFEVELEDRVVPLAEITVSPG